MFEIGMFTDRWLTGLFLIGFGAWLVFRARSMNDVRNYFRRHNCTQELESALARREALEAIPLAAWRVPGLINIVLGIVVLTGPLQGAVGYGLGVCALALSSCAAYLRIRNHGAVRAALLRPRAVASVIPPWHYAVAGLVAFTPLVLIDVPGYIAASICVCAASLTTIAVALASNNMVSILTGENVEIEMLVDQRLRQARVVALFVIGLGIPFVFLSFNSSHLHDSRLHVVTYLAVDVIWVALTLPKLIRNSGWWNSGSKAIQQ
jgi:hypothetical protein